MKSGYTLRTGNLFNTRYREKFKGALDKLGQDSPAYGLHNLRSGGITGVANKCSSKTVSVRLVKLHGRWKTDTARDMYVAEIEPRRLLVSQNQSL